MKRQESLILSYCKVISYQTKQNRASLQERSEFITGCGLAQLDDILTLHLSLKFGR